jgi:alpha-1,2-mannosyltransferase
MPSTRTIGWLLTAGSAVLAFVVRWVLVGGAPGVRGYHGYDDGVYFASSVALVHGQLPYRDFLFLHPPGITLALTPFAALTHILSDSDALVAARLAIMLAAAGSAALITRIAWRWGMAAAATGGLLFAVSSAAAYADRLTLLEPLGTLTLLGGVVLLLRAGDDGARAWWLWAGGAVLGLGVVVKIWDVVPVLVVIAWQVVVRGWPTAVRVASAAGVAVVVVLAPFAVLAGGTMFRYVVLDQLGRARDGMPATTRFAAMTGVNVTAVTKDENARLVLLGLMFVVIVGAAALAWSRRHGRLWVVMLAAQSTVLLASPSFLPHYAAYTAAALVLVLAAGVASVPARTRVPIAVLACVSVGLITGALRESPLVTFPAEAMMARLPAGCVQADAPAALALLDVLSRNLDDGCEVAIDLSGQTYDIGQVDGAGVPVERIDNRQWQQEARRYLMSGDAMVLARTRGNYFDDATLTVLDEWPTVVDVRGIQLRLPPG